VKIVWEHSIYVGNAPVFCSICGCRSYPIRSRRNQLLLAVIYDQQGVAWGEACRDCVTAGSSGIKARLRDRIQSLQEKIEELQALAIEDIETPTLEQEFQIHQQDAS
jgi:Zn-finger protein